MWCREFYDWRTGTRARLSCHVASWAVKQALRAQTWGEWSYDMMNVTDVGVDDAFDAVEMLLLDIEGRIDNSCSRQLPSQSPTSEERDNLPCDIPE